MKKLYAKAIAENKDIREVLATSFLNIPDFKLVLFEYAQSIEDWYILFDVMLLDTEPIHLITFLISVLIRKEAGTSGPVFEAIHEFWRYVCSVESLRAYLEEYFELVTAKKLPTTQIKYPERDNIKIYNSQQTEKIAAYTSNDHVKTREYVKFQGTSESVSIYHFRNPDQMQHFRMALLDKFKNTKACISRDS